MKAIAIVSDVSRRWPQMRRPKGILLLLLALCGSTFALSSELASCIDYLVSKPRAIGVRGKTAETKWMALRFLLTVLFVSATAQAGLCEDWLTITPPSQRPGLYLDLDSVKKIGPDWYQYRTYSGTDPSGVFYTMQSRTVGDLFQVRAWTQSLRQWSPWELMTKQQNVMGFHAFAMATVRDGKERARKNLEAFYRKYEAEH